MNRREMLKALALSAAATAAEQIFPGVLFANTGTATNDGLTWKKAPCRFCGTGCGVLIGAAAVGLAWLMARSQPGEKADNSAAS